MARFSGKVSDIGLDYSSLADKQLEICLYISDPTTAPGYFIVTEERWRAPDAQGSFYLEVIESGALSPPRPYRLKARWLNPPLPDGSGGGYSYYDFADWDIWITEPGGNVDDFSEPGMFSVHISETNDLRYPFWYVPSTTFLFSNP